MTREELIKDRLVAHFQKIGAAVSVTPLDNYRALPNHPTIRMGIYGPLPYPKPGDPVREEDPPLMMAVCPTHIDMITDDLDEQALDEYLGIVEYVGDMMIALSGEVLDDFERFTRIESTIVDEWGPVNELLTHVEFRALDLTT